MKITAVIAAATVCSLIAMKLPNTAGVDFIVSLVVIKFL